jgi:hypothetical protein
LKRLFGDISKKNLSTLFNNRAFPSQTFLAKALLTAKLLLVSVTVFLLTIPQLDLRSTRLVFHQNFFE